jgi:hypothetical protein
MQQPYKLEGFDKNLFKHAKSSNFSGETIIQDLTTLLKEYSGTKYDILLRDLYQLVNRMFSKLCADGIIERHLIEETFSSIIPDPVIEQLFGKDTRPIQERIILSIMYAFRHTKVQDNGIVLIDFGQ